jgi:hypothetical protein
MVDVSRHIDDEETNDLMKLEESLSERTVILLPILS